MIYITSATSGMLDSTIFQADGASVEVEQLNATENKTYTAPEGVAYSPVVVNVPTGVFPTEQKGATTYTPSTSNQTIAAGTYLTGIQTIAGDSDLVASNIKSGVNIFGVTGTYTGGGGSSTIKQGTLTISSDVTTATSTKITDTTELGFTPKAFMLMRSAASATRYHLQQTTFTTVGDTYYRTLTYRSSSAYTTSNSATNWTNQTAGYLYFNSNTVYYRSSTSYYLEAGTYYWMAMTW